MSETLPHILVVDDDRQIRELLVKFLIKHQFRVSEAASAKAARAVLKDAAIDLMVLDIMMPGEDGLSLCRQLRATSALPIILLTAMGDETDRIVGLEIGADDYLAKPFNPRELLARIRSVLRRMEGQVLIAGTESAQRFRFLGWVLDPLIRRLDHSDGRSFVLTSGECDMLLAFVSRPQRILSRDQLLDLARGRQAVPFDRSIDVQVMRLRRKLETDPKQPQIILTVRSGGYMFAPMVYAEGANG